ncbi:hypothetical protein I4U23_027465 [Adineta vaga]|nr:hypothetical protein I4U23_027465 [Adineta vaga]
MASPRKLWTERSVRLPQALPTFTKDENENQKTTAIKAIVVLVLLTFLPIATLTVGKMYQNDCPIQTWIPQWMIVFGAVGLAVFGFSTIMVVSICCRSDDDNEIGIGISACFLCLLMLFFLAWLIAGSVWVFPVRTVFQSNDMNSSTYCSDTLYKFTFGTLLAQYSLIGLFICCGVCIALILWCSH